MKKITHLPIKKLPLQNSRLMNIVGVYAGFLFLLLISYIISPASRTLQDFINLLKQSSGLGMLSIGQTMIIITGGIDLCLGSIVTLVHVLTIGLMNGDPNRIIIVCLLGMAVGTAAGFFNGIGITKAHIAPFVMTLCTDFILRGLYMIYTKGQPKGVLAEQFRNLGRLRVLGLFPIGVLCWIVLSVFFIFILKKTIFGNRIHMIGANPVCSTLSGVKNEYTIILVYTIAGFIAALTSIVLTMDMSAASLNLGADYSMDSISATVVGGTLFAGGIGGIEGTIAGAMIIRLITSLLQKANIVNWAKLMIQSVLIFSVVAANSRRKST
ncbi:MAG: Ribose transport system permease protein RbsC [Spirochaetes bacterium ADurb.Bin110]|nr:MAG: Ribose transport system permease protein RbsC [Spirochaetes bacterium ADurb.Bin110]